MSRRRVSPPALFAAIVFGVLLGLALKSPPKAPPKPTSYPAQPAPPATPGLAPMDFELRDGGGRIRTLGGLIAKGERALVYLYAPGCGHCMKMLPRFVEPARRIEERGVPVIGVQYYGTSQSLDEAARSAAIPGFLLADPEGKFCGAVGVGEFTVLVVASTGGILHRSGEDFEVLETLFPNAPGRARAGAPGQLER